MQNYALSLADYDSPTAMFFGLSAAHMRRAFSNEEMSLAARQIHILIGIMESPPLLIPFSPVIAIAEKYIVKNTIYKSIDSAEEVEEGYKFKIQISKTDAVAFGAILLAKAVMNDDSRYLIGGLPFVAWGLMS